MQGYSHTTILGNVTRAPETRNTANGTLVAQLSVAVNGWGKDRDGNDRVSYVDVTAFGKSAEFVQQYVTRGACIIVGGSLQQDTWEDKQTGQKRRKLIVIAERVQFAGPKPDVQDARQERAPQQAPRPQAQPVQDESDEETLPF